MSLHKQSDRGHLSAVVSPEHDSGVQRRSWSVLVVALAAQILVVLDISVVNTALPTIARSLQLGSDQLQWLVTAYLLMSGGGLLLGGRIADLLSRRHVFMSGLALFTTASLVAGLSSGAGALIAARAAQGMGAALLTPAALSLIMTTYSGVQRARGLALWAAVGSMGVAAGVLFGGALTTWAGWQTIFFINVPIGVAAFVAALHLLPKDHGQHAGLSRLDLPGGVTVVGGLAALLLGIQRAGQHGWTDAGTLAFFGTAAVLLAAFTAIEKRVSSPLVPPHTWKVKTLVSGTTVMLGVTGILVGVIFLTSVFVQTALGYSAIETGLAFLPLTIAVAAATHVASRLASRVSARGLATSGLALAVAGALLLSRAQATSHYATDLLPALLVLGFGTGLVFVSASTTAMTGIPAQHAGLASGFLMTGHEIGAALGVAVVSAAAMAAGSLTSSTGIVAAYGRGMVAVAILGAVMAVIAMTRVPAIRQQPGAAMHMHH